MVQLRNVCLQSQAYKIPIFYIILTTSTTLRGSVICAGACRLFVYLCQRFVCLTVCFRNPDSKTPVTSPNILTLALFKDRKPCLHHFPECFSPFCKSTMEIWVLSRKWDWTGLRALSEGLRPIPSLSDTQRFSLNTMLIHSSFIMFSHCSSMNGWVTARKGKQSFHQRCHVLSVML